MKSDAWGGLDFPVLTPHDLLNTWGADYGYTDGYGMSGKTHPGLDISMPVGTKLYALADGKVDYIRDENYPTGTKEIVVLTDAGHRHLYTHTSKRDVAAGDRVTRGQVIGRSGDPTGHPHLHFEHRIPDASTEKQWRIIDPTPLLTSVSSGGPPVSTPTIYDLRNNADAARFGLTPAQRDQFMQGCFRNRSGAKPRAIFCHVQEGSTKGSLKWAIEKSGSQNSYSATVQLDGTILMCIPEEHGPWTNGAVRSPKPKAKKLLDLGGNPNIYTLSIEAEGYWNKPHPQVQIDSIFWLINHWSKKYNIPVLGDDSAGDWLFEHADVDNVQRTNCAGPYYDTIQKMVRAGAKPTPTYPSVVPIPILDDISSGPGIAPTYVYDPKTDLDFWWAGDTYRVIKKTRQRRFALLNSDVVDDDLNVGDEFSGDWTFRNQDGRWIYTPDGRRIFADDVIRISDSKKAA